MTNSADQQQHRTIINTPSDIIKGISRRAVLKGFVGAAGLMATGIGFTSAPLALATNTRQAASSSTAHPIGTTLYVFNDQFKGIYSVEWSPDGKRILTTGIGPLEMKILMPVPGTQLLVSIYLYTLTQVAGMPHGRPMAQWLLLVVLIPMSRCIMQQLAK